MPKVEKTKGTDHSKQHYSGSLAVWAEDNDIPAADLTRAYSSRAKPAPFENRRVEQVNAGLSRQYVLIL